MNVKLKKLREQVIVITGASSGIGLVTARMAAKCGARVVLNARNKETLDKIKDEINLAGGEAIVVAGDVGEFDDVKRIADEAVDHFGGFDTWVNNAAVSIYGPLLDQPLIDQQRLFQTNYWGVVNGSIVATEHLRIRGGALINVGSILSDRAIPVQGSYCASKHAVKGYTDALRMELEKETAPISVTLIKPSSIDTPYRQHARNLMTVEPLQPPPVYAPETVAEAILHCAENSVREVYVGAAAKALAASAYYAPGLTDGVMEAVFFDLQRSDQPKPPNRSDSLYEPLRDGEERGAYPGHVAESSLYTRAALHGVATVALLSGAAGLALFAWLRSARSRRTKDEYLLDFRFQAENPPSHV